MNPSHVQGANLTTCKSRNDYFENLAERSSIPGIFEIYSSKNWFWCILWGLLLIGCATISVFQIYQSLSGFVEHPTKIEIRILDEDEQPYYPPLVICYPHWLLWVDEVKVLKLDIDKNVLLTGLSYLTPIYSNTEFDVNETRGNFFQIIKREKIEYFLDFYFAIAKDTPPFFRLFAGPNFHFSKRIIAARPNDLAMCYILTSENVTNLLAKDLNLNIAPGSRSAARSISLVYNDNFSPYPKNIMDKEEVTVYLSSVLTAIYGSKAGLNETIMSNVDLKWPPRFSVDGNEIHAASQTFTSGVYRYVIKLQGKVFKWMKGLYKPCKNDKVLMQYYEECSNGCVYEKYTELNSEKNCFTYFDAIHMKNISFENVCPSNVYFNATEMKIRAETDAMKSTFIYVNSGNCTKRKCSTSCEEWVYESITSSSSFDQNLKQIGVPTIITIDYPQSGAIIVYAEVVSQTWDTLVGNVGGILGLWLGASILSFWQMFYLLCCYKR